MPWDLRFLLLAGSIDILCPTQDEDTAAVPLARTMHLFISSLNSSSKHSFCLELFNASDNSL
jgi:hypothetical protein